MTDTDEEFEREERRERLRTRATQGAVVALVLFAGIGGWLFLSRESDPTKRDVPPSTIIPVEVPPPPPPPPPEEQPEPQEAEPEEEPIAEPETPPEPQAQEAPAPGPEIDGPAQAGGDSFGVRSGPSSAGPIVGGGAPGGTGRSGGGGGFAESGYNRYLTSVLQRAVQGDNRVNRRVFSAEVALWIDERGRITRASLLRTSGDERVDQSLIERIQSLALDQPPPPSLRFPQRVQVRGRRA